jgi:hypothetical protein
LYKQTRLYFKFDGGWRHVGSWWSDSYTWSWFHVLAFGKKPAILTILMYSSFLCHNLRLSVYILHGYSNSRITNTKKRLSLLIMFPSKYKLQVINILIYNDGSLCYFFYIWMSNLNEC